MRRLLQVFVKFPTPGRVKSRLAATLGAEAAAEIYRDLVARVLRNLAGLDADLRVLFDPPGAGAATAAWIGPQVTAAGLPSPEFLPQAQGDLGARLAHAFDHAFAAGFRHVAAIGSDCVDIPARLLATAWDALDTHDATVGPTDDGGYYLLALRCPCPALFRNIPWSTDRTLSATLEAAAAEGLRVAHLARLRDIDTLADWQALNARPQPPPP